MHYTVTCVSDLRIFSSRMVFRFESVLEALAFEETQLDPDLRAWPWAEVKFEAWEHEVSDEQQKLSELTTIPFGQKFADKEDMSPGTRRSLEGDL